MLRRWGAVRTPEQCAPGMSRGGEAAREVCFFQTNPRLYVLFKQGSGTEGGGSDPKQSAAHFRLIFTFPR